MLKKNLKAKRKKSVNCWEQRVLYSKEIPAIVVTLLYFLRRFSFHKDLLVRNTKYKKTDTV
jgi:hypothetical protein